MRLLRLLNIFLLEIININKNRGSHFILSHPFYLFVLLFRIIGPLFNRPDRIGLKDSTAKLQVKWKTETTKKSTPYQEMACCSGSINFFALASYMGPWVLEALVRSNRAKLGGKAQT